MDDLSSVEWTAPKPKPAGQQYPQSSGNYYQTLRPTPPVSGRSTPSMLQPISRPSSNGPARSNASTPANDSFANLVSFNAAQSNKGLSLQEQQRKLREEKAREEAEKRRAFDAQFGSQQASMWNVLGDGRTTPNRMTSPPTYTATNEYGGQKLSKIINKPFAAIPVASPSSPAPTPEQDDDVLLAAFNASAPVDKASHMPDASRSVSVDRPDAFAGATVAASGSSTSGTNTLGGGDTEDIDDDPFGLGTSNSTKKIAHASDTNRAATDEDDVLGLLGRPVSEFPKKEPIEPPAPKSSKGAEVHPQEKAIAELVDMGFTPEKSKNALEATESGTDVQAAVGWLLNQAHEESRKEKQPQIRVESNGDASRSSQTKRAPGRRKSSTSDSPKPAWMREQDRSTSRPTRPDNRSPVNGEKDPAQYASEIGSKVFKTAGSLWKTGTKKLNQAVSELNSDSDSSQPKWMRDAQPEATIRKPRSQQRESDVNDHDRMTGRSFRQPTAPVQDSSVTDEALMLEADSRPPPRKPRPKIEVAPEKPERSSVRAQQPPQTLQHQSMPQPKFMQQAQPREPKARLTRQAIEEEAAKAYISPARRKKPIAKPDPSEPEPDLLAASSKALSQPALSRPTPSPRPTPVSTPLPTRPPPPKRNIPSLSSFTLQASTKGRQEGNAAFKRGDYAQATIHYSSSLQALPPTHPLTIVLLTNRALSLSKTGDPKASIADAKSAIDLIGPSRGSGETIDLGSDEGMKQMGTYWDKAMSRQAEALEHLERWSEAASTWRSCVEAGVGGATAIAGRTRSEKAAAPPSQARTSAAHKKATPKLRPKPTALGDLAPDSESVTRLRAANAAADRLDDEKFALADVVDGRVSRWRAGKEGNLRALLATLETVLWEDSGWKKVTMGDVLLPGKVKIVYMKGIAKVHPDKVCLSFRAQGRA